MTFKPTSTIASIDVRVTIFAEQQPLCFAWLERAPVFRASAWIPAAAEAGLRHANGQRHTGQPIPLPIEQRAPAEPGSPLCKTIRLRATLNQIATPLLLAWLTSKGEGYAVCCLMPLAESGMRSLVGDSNPEVFHPSIDTTRGSGTAALALSSPDTSSTPSATSQLQPQVSVPSAPVATGLSAMFGATDMARLIGFDQMDDLGDASAVPSTDVSSDATRSGGLTGSASVRG